MAYWGTIGTGDIANDAITSALIATGAVGSDEIANDSIVNADINSAAAIAYSKLNLTGSIVPGDFDASVTLDDFTAAGTVNMSSNQFSNLPAATAAGEAVEFSQFENALDGLSYKEQVLVATTGNITLSGEQTIDGVLTSTSRVLVKNQTAPAENGIYVSAAGAWVRADDVNTAAEIDDGATVWVQQGTANKDTRWTQTATVVTLGSDTVTWSQTGSATVVSAMSDLSDADTTGAVDGSLLRYEASASEWQATTAADLLLTDAGRLLLPVTGASGGVLLGGDAQLYRDAANLIRTPDSLTVDQTLQVSGRTYLAGGLRVGVQSVTDHTADPVTDHVLIVDSSAATRTVTLPATHASGSHVIVKRNGANDVTIATADADTIDGAASYTIDVDQRAITVVSDGTNWHII